MENSIFIRLRFFKILLQTSICFSQEISKQNNSVLVDLHRQDEKAASSTYCNARKQLQTLSP